MNHHDSFSSEHHYAKQTARLLSDKPINVDKALAHYSALAVEAAELAQSQAKPVVFVIVEPGTGVYLASQTCECGELLSAFGSSEASAVRNVAGEVFEHMHGSVTHS